MLSNFVLEKTPESPVHFKIKPVNPKGNQPWIFIGRTDAEAEAPILWPLDAKNWLVGKDPMLGKIEGGRRGWQRMKWLDDIIDSMDMSLRRLREVVKDRKAWRATVYGAAKSQLWLSDWTTTMKSVQTSNLKNCKMMLSALFEAIGFKVICYRNKRILNPQRLYFQA